MNVTLPPGSVLQVQASVPVGMLPQLRISSPSRDTHQTFHSPANEYLQIILRDSSQTLVRGASGLLTNVCEWSLNSNFLPFILPKFKLLKKYQLATFELSNGNISVKNSLSILFLY